MNRLQKARLKAAQVRWAREDRERGYTVYRRPTLEYRRLQARRHRKQIAEVVEVLVILALVGVMLGISLTN